MNAYEFILQKQIAWAARHRIHLIGSQGERGRKAYTETLNDNLYRPLLPESEVSFLQGDGGELKGNPRRMQAVHSSSALAVNMFQYWTGARDVPCVAHACGLCGKGNRGSERIRFEAKYPVLKSAHKHPNVDVVMENGKDDEFAAYAVESKFSEVYRATRKAHGVNPHYLKQENSGIWSDIPGLRDLAEGISPVDTTFRRLDPAQLIKHILGLKQEYGKKRFKLLYLWYDAFGSEGTVHRQETIRFSEAARGDGINFRSATYQEVLAELSAGDSDAHREFVFYMCDRYM
jgi:hypothetical protein